MGFFDRFKKFEKKAKDPVCGMEKPEREFKFNTEYKGKIYYFCSLNCQRMFEGTPRGYTGDRGSERKSR